jgi:hypothetical protein
MNCHSDNGGGCSGCKVAADSSSVISKKNFPQRLFLKCWWLQKKAATTATTIVHFITSATTATTTVIGASHEHL